MWCTGAAGAGRMPADSRCCGRERLLVCCSKRPSFAKPAPRPGSGRPQGPPGRRGPPGGRRGGRGGGGRAGPGGREKGKAKEAEPKLTAGGPVTPAMQVAVQEQLTPLDKVPQPLWATFCGVTNGVWQGRMAAFYAATGEPEAVSLDGKERVYDLHTLVVEGRTEGGAIQRHTLRSAKLAAIRAATLPDPNTAVEPAPLRPGASQAWEPEVLAEDEEGFVIFDGGSFSRGPYHLLPPEPDSDESESESEGEGESEGEFDAEPEAPVLLDADFGQEPEDGGLEEGAIPSQTDTGEDAPRQVAVVEHCLAWGGEQRLRLALTLSAGVAKRELDVEVLRLALYREAWQGLAEDCARDACVATGVRDPGESESPLSSAPRMAARALEGVWKALDLSAVPVEEQDPLTGEARRILLYFNQETSQQWSLGKAGKSSQGAALWLPGSVLVELQMVAPSSRGSQADAAEGMGGGDGGGGGGRGLLLTFSWAPKEGMVISVHREYDASGELLECRSRSAVRGSWVGGSM